MKKRTIIHYSVINFSGKRSRFCREHRDVGWVGGVNSNSAQLTIPLGQMLSTETLLRGRKTGNQHGVPLFTGSLPLYSTLICRVTLCGPYSLLPKSHSQIKKSLYNHMP